MTFDTWKCGVVPVVLFGLTLQMSAARAGTATMWETAFDVAHRTPAPVRISNALSLMMSLDKAHYGSAQYVNWENANTTGLEPGASHVESFFRLPDINGDAYFVGVNAYDNYGKMWVLKVPASSITSGYVNNATQFTVVWRGQFDSDAMGGIYNHPGMISGIGSFIVIPAQNWQLSLGNPSIINPHSTSAALFFDMQDPAHPTYLGKIKRSDNGDVGVSVLGRLPSGNYILTSGNLHGDNVIEYWTSSQIRPETFVLRSSSNTDGAYFEQNNTFIHQTDNALYLARTWKQGIDDKVNVRSFSFNESTGAPTYDSYYEERVMYCSYGSAAASLTFFVGAGGVNAAYCSEHWQGVDNKLVFDQVRASP